MKMNKRERKKKHEEKERQHAEQITYSLAASLIRERKQEKVTSRQSLVTPLQFFG
jgi:hypothetical protein